MSNRKCESVAASELSRTQSKDKNKGWYEDEDPLLGKAKRHHEVAMKKEFEKHGFTDATQISPHEDDIISVCFNVEKKDLPEFNKATKKFMEENDISVETEAKGDKITVKLPVENLEDFVEFLGDEGFKLDSDEEEQVETILEKDDAKTAKTDKIEEEDGNNSK